MYSGSLRLATLKEGRTIKTRTLAPEQISQTRCQSGGNSEHKRNSKDERIAIMLNNAKTLKGYQLHGLDGEIGKVKEFYFDVFVSLSREAIRQSPEYRMESPPTREYEKELHLHYDRLGYWLDEPAGEKYLART